MNTPSIAEMLKAGMHFGHRTGKWHPKMQPYIFGERHGVHVIDLVKSRKMLESSLELLKKFASEGKTILFVGTKIQVKSALKEVALTTEMPYVTEKWLGGTLTNFAIIKKMAKKYKDLTEDKKAGRLDRYTKKEQVVIEKDMAKMSLRVGGLTEMNRLPDLIFVWDVKVEKTAVTEARKRNIPIVAICDTNVNPTGINYIIPSNDDATMTVKLLLDAVTGAVMEGKKEAAKKSVPNKA